MLGDVIFPLWCVDVNSQEGKDESDRDVMEQERKDLTGLVDLLTLQLSAIL